MVVAVVNHQRPRKIGGLVLVTTALIWNLWGARSSVSSVSVVSREDTVVFISNATARKRFQQVVNQSSINRNHDEESLVPTPTPQMKDIPPIILKKNKTRTRNPVPHMLPDEERDHPHKGARDENGKLGYRTDPTKVRQWMIRRYQRETNQTGLPPIDWIPQTLLSDSTNPCGSLRYSDATNSILKIQPNHRGPSLYNETLPRIQVRWNNSMCPCLTFYCYL